MRKRALIFKLVGYLKLAFLLGGCSAASPRPASSTPAASAIPKPQPFAVDRTATESAEPIQGHLELDWQSAPLSSSCPIAAPTSNSDTPTNSQTSLTPGTVQNASEVVGAMRSDFHTCYTEELKRDPNIEGHSMLKFRLTCDGMVTSIHASTDGLPQKLVNCLMARVRSSTFAPPEGGSATIQVPLTFKKQ